MAKRMSDNEYTIMQQNADMSWNQVGTVNTDVDAEVLAAHMRCEGWQEHYDVSKDMPEDFKISSGDLLVDDEGQHLSAYVNRDEHNNEFVQLTEVSPDITQEPEPQLDPELEP